MEPTGKDVEPTGKGAEPTGKGAEPEKTGGLKDSVTCKCLSLQALKEGCF